MNGRDTKRYKALSFKNNFYENLQIFSISYKIPTHFCFNLTPPPPKRKKKTRSEDNSETFIELNNLF